MASLRQIKIGTPRQFGWLRGVVITILLLNLLDAVLTTFWLSAGAATEANPAMSVLLEHGGFVLFVVAKLGLVSLGCALLWRQRQRGIAVVGVFLLFTVYYAVMLHHMDALSMVLTFRMGLGLA